jgi:glycosyltransferase involved in cell wall biosynthesis
MDRIMKVLHLPTTVGGNSWGLSQAERKLGIDSKVLIDTNNWLNHESDICLYQQNDSKFYKLYKRIEAFIKYRNKFDVFHFNFGSSLIDFPKYGINLLDLPFYKGRKVVTYNGCDARQKYPTIQRVDFSACHEKECYGGMCNSGRMDKIRRKKIEKFNKYADHIFALNPDLMYFLPKDKTTFLPYTISGWDNIHPVKYKIDKKIKIIHAPTNRSAKGSKYIINALKNLEKKYKNIELVIIEKIPRKDALKLYQESHIIIDQVLIGWYGAFAAEAMKMGKPVAVFIRKEDLKLIPSQMAHELEETVININPFNIEEELSKYIENPKFLYEKSEASLTYVNKWHDPIYVAGLVIDIYKRIL